MNERLEGGESPALSESDQMLEKLNDPNYLPSWEDVGLALGGKNKHRADQYFYHDDAHHVFEILTQEYVTAFGQYLSGRIDELSTGNKPVRILEVGAGNGRLAHFMKEELEKTKAGKFQIVATDSMERGFEPNYPVEEIDYKDALAKYQPEIVICSWMPYSTDWTANFRSTPSVKEYILIGESYLEVCGDPWLTWGQKDSDEESAEVPPYQKDGFVDSELAEVTKYQISQSDTADFGLFKYFKHGGDSRTISFRKRT